MIYAYLLLQISLAKYFFRNTLNHPLFAFSAPIGYAVSEVNRMEAYHTGHLIARLRSEWGLTQKQLAEQLHVSPQAVSKWERGLNCPDAGLLPALSALLGVSAERLLSGDLTPNKQEVGNMKRMKFYMCPVCGNIITASGGGEFHCCGRKLEPMKARPADEAHAATVQEIEEDLYVTFSHPMEKGHYIRFAASVAMDRVLLVRLYPEQGGEVRLPNLRRGSKLYLGCSRDGLFEIPLK